MSEKREFGELELAILKLFKGKERLTVRDVLNALGGEDKYTTVMTVMNRLYEKKSLVRRRNGQQYEYWLNSKKKNIATSVLERLKQVIFGGNTVSMASYLIESGGMSDAELAQVESLVKEARSQRDKR